MLQGQSHDDVLELCRYVPMDPHTYKRFEFAVTRPTPMGDVTHHQEGNGTPTTAGANNAVRGDARPATTEGATTPPFTTTEPRVIGEISSPLSVQEAAYSAATLLQTRGVVASTPATESTPNNLSALAAIHNRSFDTPAVLPVMSGVGGSGATTVLAGLGRALSILGERVLLVDARGPSTLDCFYESNTTKTNLLLSTGAMSQFEGAVHVLRTHSDTPCGSQSYTTKFCRVTAGLSGHIDRILVAGTDWFAPAIEQRAWSGGVCLLVVTPELRSVMAVPSILKAIAERAKQTGQHIEPWFILNRFVESSTMHANMRSRLAAQLGNRLLPFCIPETDLVEQALMRETNVLDLAPESAFADTCFTLAEWYRTNSVKTSARLSSPAEETQLVSERS